MAVRRLADKSVQPKEFAFTAENRAWAEKTIAKYPESRQASAVIPLLWKAQEQAGGWVPEAAIRHVGEMLDMPFIRVLEVATFYTMFNLAPVGQYHVQMCGTTPCMLRGAGELIDICHKRIGEQFHVAEGGKLSWVEVECLGACVNAPMAQINYDFFEDLTPESFNRILDDLIAGRPVKPGPQVERQLSAPIGGLTTLNTPGLYDPRPVAGAQGDAATAVLDDAAKKPGVPASIREAPAPAENKSAEVTAPPQASGEVAAPADAAALAQQEELAIAAKLATLPEDATAEQKANAVGVRPQGLAAARDNKADDLKRIRGIGPVNEGKLNALGIYHFDQVAAWKRDEIRWVGTYLAFPGRIDREGWVSQASVLASGQETDFSKRVGRGEVPTSSGTGQKA